MLSAQPPFPFPHETAIKEYLMLMQRVRGRLRGQKESYITVAFRDSGCCFMPAVSTNSIQNKDLVSHNSGRGKRKREKVQEA